MALPSLQKSNIVSLGQERDQPKVFRWVMEKVRIMELCLTIFSPPNFIWHSLYEVRISVNEFLNSYIIFLKDELGSQKKKFGLMQTNAKINLLRNSLKWVN